MCARECVCIRLSERLFVCEQVSLFSIAVAARLSIPIPISVSISMSIFSTHSPLKTEVFLSATRPRSLVSLHNEDKDDNSFSIQFTTEGIV